MDTRRLTALLGDISEKRLLVIGDVMLDHYLWGNVHRISPEAPVPVVQVTRESSNPGGAANVARNLAPFIKQVFVIGAIGTDLHASQLVDQFQRCGLDPSSLLREEGRETVVKTRVIARGQQVCRIDRETKRPLPESLVDQALAHIDSLFPLLDGVILQDYAKGMLSQRMVDRVVRKARERGVWVAGDPNPQNALDWRGVGIMKPNRQEAFMASGLVDQPFTEPLEEDRALRELALRLRRQWECAHLLITLADQGMVLAREDGSLFHCPARLRDVFDVSGAGDTAIALFAAAICGGATAEEASELANDAAGLAVGKLGTATVSPEELLTNWEKKA